MPPKAMILAAGRGERLRPLTDRTPKPMVPIGSEPLIVHQLRWLRRGGLRDVVINLHHLGDQIEARVGNGHELGLRVRYSWEDEPLETGGGVKRALAHLRPGPFVVLNGDVWTNYSFANLLALRPRRAHLVLTPKPSHRSAADFHLRGERVLRSARNDLTYCGIAVLAPALFATAPEGRFSLRDLYFGAAAAGELTGERFDGVWADIGTPEQLAAVRCRAR